MLPIQANLGGTPSSSSKNQPTEGKALTKKTLDSLKKNGYLEKINMLELIDICSQIEIPLLNATGFGYETHLEINKHKVAFIQLGKVTFQTFVQSTCTPQVAEKTLSSYAPLAASKPSIRKNFEANCIAAIVRSEDQFETQITRAAERLDTFLQTYTFKEFGMDETHINEFYRLQFLQVTVNQNPWKLIAHNFWKFTSLYVAPEYALKSMPSELKGQKLLWGSIQYPHWQKTILNKFMSVPHLSLDLNDDVAFQIIGRLFVLSLYQPIEEAIACRPQTNATKRGGNTLMPKAKRIKTS